MSDRVQSKKNMKHARYLAWERIEDAGLSIFKGQWCQQDAEDQRY